jgi:hypothetical protein
MSKDDPKLGLAEAARRAGVTPQAICRAAEEGRLPFEREPDGTRRFSSTAVGNYAATLRARPGKARAAEVESTGPNSLVSTSTSSLVCASQTLAAIAVAGQEPCPRGIADQLADLELKLRSFELEATLHENRRRSRLADLLARLACDDDLLQRYRFEASRTLVAAASDQTLADEDWPQPAYEQALSAAQDRWLARCRRLDQLQTALASALLAARWHPQQIALAVQAVMPMLGQLDDATLAGELWPAHFALIAACRWAGLAPPSTPWTIGAGGLRPIGPGD